MGCWGVRVRVGIGSTPSTTYTLRYQFSVNNINTDVSADACCCFGWCGENTPSHLSILNNAEVTGDTSSEALSIKVVQARSNGWRYHTFCDVARTRGARVAVRILESREIRLWNKSDQCCIFIVLRKDRRTFLTCWPCFHVGICFTFTYGRLSESCCTQACHH